jgi:hypothetical protein
VKEQNKFELQKPCGTRFSLKIWACMVLQHLLNEDQQQNHVEVSKDLVDHVNADDNLFGEHHHGR